MLTDAWPTLDFALWAPTKRSLHLYAQILGKIRLALAPHQPNFVFTALALTPRGFSTGLMPFANGGLEVAVDVFSVELVIQLSDGRERRLTLKEPCTVAPVFGEVHRALAHFGIPISLSPIPQEIPDVTPLDQDERPAVFDPAAAQRWHTVATAAHSVFDRWRSHFAGRMGIYLWWGGFDLSLMLFNGKHVPAPTDRGYLLKYDLDAELMNAGFYPGDDANPPIFYGYIFPQPKGCEALPIAPEGAAWSDKAGEWILPYATVAASSDPEKLLTDFLDAIYSACGVAGGWNHAELTYTRPPLRRARS